MKAGVFLQPYLGQSVGGDGGGGGVGGAEERTARSAIKRNLSSKSVLLNSSRRE
jgi:hypothetical protein